MTGRPSSGAAPVHQNGASLSLPLGSAKFCPRGNLPTTRCSSAGSGQAAANARI